MISKYKNSQVVFIDGDKLARIKRVIKKEKEFVYEMRDSGDVLPEERLSLLKN